MAEDINLTGNEFEFGPLSEARNYRQAILSVFGPFARGKTLEVGCGVGQFTRDLQSYSPSTQVTGLEPDPTFHARFVEYNPNIPVVKGTAQDIGGQWDCIVSVNVLEHIKEDKAELEIYRGLLNKGGHVCVFVPARQEIYAPVDAKFGHFRRYSRSQLQKCAEAAGFRIVHLEYFNPIGYLTWFLACKIMKRETFSLLSIKLFDRWILPVSLGLGRLLGNPIGQSVIMVAARAEDA